MTVAKLESLTSTRPLVPLPGFSSSFASSVASGLDVAASHSVFQPAMIRSIDAVIATTQLVIVNQWDDSSVLNHQLNLQIPTHF